MVRTRDGVTFNVKQVEPFISRFRDTLRLAKLGVGNEEAEETELDTANNGNGPKAPPKGVQVGSFVQWTSQGVSQFPKPLKVQGVEGVNAFVEGIQAGLPMSELAVVDPPAEQSPPPAPPQNPFFKPAVEQEPQHSGPEVRFPLDGGSNEVVIRLKKPVSKKDFDRITQLLQLSEDSLVKGED